MFNRPIRSVHCCRCTVTALLMVIGLSSFDAMFGAEKKSRRRVPDHFAKLDLRDEQREGIYRIQDRFAPRIASLQRQLADLRERRETEFRSLLTHEQRVKLDTFRKDAKPEPAEELFEDQWGLSADDPVQAPVP